MNTRYLAPLAFAAALGWRSRFDMLALVGAGFIALGGVARMLAGVHACDPGCSPLRPSVDQDLHNVAARIAYLAMIVAAIYWGVVGNRYAALRRLSPLGIGCGVWAVVFLVLMLAVGSTEGLFQRLASGVEIAGAVVDQRDFHEGFLESGKSPMTGTPR